MPTSLANASGQIEAYRRAKKAIEATFNGETTEDAWKIYHLMERGGDNDGIYMSIYSGFLFSVCASGSPLPYISIPVLLMAAFISARYFYRQKIAARQEFKALIAADPIYWMPIAKKLEEIILEAGKIEYELVHPIGHGTHGTRQVTKLVYK